MPTFVDSSLNIFLNFLIGRDLFYILDLLAAFFSEAISVFCMTTLMPYKRKTNFGLPNQ